MWSPGVSRLSAPSLASLCRDATSYATLPAMGEGEMRNYRAYPFAAIAGNRAGRGARAPVLRGNRQARSVRIPTSTVIAVASSARISAARCRSSSPVVSAVPTT